MTIGARLRGLRAAKELSQGALAEAVGIGQPHLSALESSGNVGNMRVNTLLRLAEKLEVRADAILYPDSYEVAIERITEVEPNAFQPTEASA